jgi:predicted transposase YbfD/YdcC
VCARAMQTTGATRVDVTETAARTEEAKARTEELRISSIEREQLSNAREQIRIETMQECFGYHYRIPKNMGLSIEVFRRYWQLVRLRHVAQEGIEYNEKERKARAMYMKAGEQIWQEHEAQQAEDKAREEANKFQRRCLARLDR